MQNIEFSKGNPCGRHHNFGESTSLHTDNRGNRHEWTVCNLRTSSVPRAKTVRVGFPAQQNSQSQLDATSSKRAKLSDNVRRCQTSCYMCTLHTTEDDAKHAVFLHNPRKSTVIAIHSDLKNTSDLKSRVEKKRRRKSDTLTQSNWSHQEIECRQSPAVIEDKK